MNYLFLLYLYSTFIIAAIPTRNDAILFFIVCKGNPREFPVIGAD